MGPIQLLTWAGLGLATLSPDCPKCIPEAPLASVEQTDTVPPEEPTLELDLGGALRYNYHYKDWERESFSLQETGDFEFDTFRLNADGSYGNLLFSAEYRFYPGYQMIHHGWVGYDFSDALQLQVGVNRVPFGPLPYASHNYFFQLPYYVGLEDDYDNGIRVSYTPGPWDVRLAFYPNSEGSFTGESLASARYSYDVVPTTESELGYAGLTTDRFNEEANQFNARVAYALPLSEETSAEIGISGQRGQLFNSETQKYGKHWAASVHLDASHGRWDFKAEALRYSKQPINPAGQDDRFVVMGAYDAPYKVASEADMYLAGLGYTVPTNWGPVSSIQFYNDYTYMRKEESEYSDTQQNVLGALISAGPLFVYVDAASGKHHPWLGPSYGTGLAEGGTDDGWHTRFNISIGYYF